MTRHRPCRHCDREPEAKREAIQGPNALLDCFGAKLLAMTAPVIVRGLLPIARACSIKAMRNPAIYIMANKRNGTLYTGVTSNLSRRAWEHREALNSGFTARYGCKLLVWFEYHDSMQGAIAREKQIKTGSRKKKLTLIEALNPAWRDLYEDLA